MHDDLRAKIDEVFPSVRADLERLVRVPSISLDGPDTPALRAAADLVVELLTAAGAPARKLELPDAPAAVFAEAAGPEGAPTVLLYAHYDVQPPGNLDDWSGDPFEPVERNGRLHGRAASDDKSGVAAHLAVLRAFEGAPPVNLKLFIEGEEEIGSPNFARFIETFEDELRADVIVIADSEHWAVGQPALTTSLRGVVDCVVEVRTLNAAVHSGQFGGAVPDALSSLARLLATLHDDEGRAAVEGLVATEADPLDLTEADLRDHAGVVDGVELVGEGSLTSRLWRRPAISVLAIDAPRISEAINQIVPVARAKVSMRLAPGDDGPRALAALTRHLESHAPWGARVTVKPGPGIAAPFELNTEGAAYDAFRAAYLEAWGRESIEIGIGGSIPLVADLQVAYPEASILLTGVGEPTSRIHGPDESQDLQELRRNCLAEAIALSLIGGN
ncbi:MAG: dipeptidase [Chloroflexi bacterium]|nr:dipeptidase [Chloroflexota bacterium]MDA1145803.1 dipeptidase [Chloroflexota bacterium]